MILDPNKICWQLIEMTGDGPYTARVEGEKYGKYYTAVCQWEDGTPTEVTDIEEIREKELFNRPQELKQVKI